MTHLDITLDLSLHPWADCRHLKQLGTVARIGRLPGGTDSGKSTVTVLVTMPDGKQVMAQTTMALFLAAAQALRGADERGRN